MSGDIHTCRVCRLYHARVEAAGIYHCPNTLCEGPGATHVRYKLKSFREVDSQSHIVDYIEWVIFALQQLSTEQDVMIRNKILESAAERLLDSIEYDTMEHPK